MRKTLICAWIVGAIALDACVTPSGLGPRVMDQARPNIILILTDDQPPHTLEYMPTVRRELVATGVNFINAYVTTPFAARVARAS